MLSDVNILTPEQEQQLLHQFNNTTETYPKDENLVTLFEDQVKRTPKAISVIFEDQELTYQELNERSNQLAHYLIKQGTKAETLIPICVERNIEMIVGILGILKAGCAYVPVDPQYPADRISYMLEDTGVSANTGSSAAREKIGQSNAKIIELDGDRGQFEKEQNSNLSAVIRPDQLAYVIYTSGSTGRPKGVMIEYRTLINYLYNNKTNYINNEKSTSGSFIHLSYTFDASLTGLFMPLLSGKYLVIGSKQSLDVFTDPNLEKHAPYDFIKITPAHIGLLPTDFKTRDGKWLTDKLVIGGEALRLNQIESLIKERISVEIINEYGPTEATVGCSTYNFWTLENHGLIGNEVPIGKPISNTRIYILSNDKEFSPIGVTGEIFIGGAGLARGYLNRAELTGEKFVEDPFSNETNARLYKTGDLGRWLPDGNIEYLGRIDDQVKIRGYRIELGEIESVLNTSELVDQAVVLAKEDKQGTKRLVGYVVSSGVFANKLASYKAYLKLENFLIIWCTVLWVELDMIPLTPNGKIDRKALPDPDLADMAAVYVAPRNEMETKLAEIWQELLGLERVGIFDNFFELGGHSLLAMRVVTAIRMEFSVTIPIHMLFQFTSISDLSKYLQIETDTNNNSSEMDTGTFKVMDI